jgi:hypothetical protein
MPFHFRDGGVDWERDESPQPARIPMQASHCHDITKVEGEVVQLMLRVNEATWRKIEAFAKMFLADGSVADVPIWGPDKFYARREEGRYYVNGSDTAQCWTYRILWSARLNGYCNQAPDWHEVWNGSAEQSVAILSEAKVSVDGKQFVGNENSHTLYVGTYGRQEKTQQRICHNQGDKLDLHEWYFKEFADLLGKNRRRALSDYKAGLLYNGLFPKEEKHG